jgi:tetratricopeptide (TPR) repeat protein
VKVTVLANGIDVGTAELRNADPVVTEWIVPSTALARHDPATLVLLSQDRGSHPAYANGKLFAFSVYSLLVTAADAIENIPVRPLAPRVDNLPSSTAGRRIEKVAASVWSSLPLGGGKRHVEAARDAMRRKDWQKAVGHYAAAVKAAPSRAAVWVQYGHALKESGDCATAETAYQKALSLAPDVADTYVQLGHVTKLMGLLDAAVTYYRRAIELDPLRADAAAELDVLAPQSNPLAAVQLLKMTRPGTQPRASA